MVLVNLFAGKEWDTVDNGLVNSAGGREWDTRRKQQQHISTSQWKTDGPREVAVWHGEPGVLLCGDLGGLSGQRGGRLGRDGIYGYYGWFALLCGRDQHNTVEIKKKILLPLLYMNAYDIYIYNSNAIYITYTYLCIYILNIIFSVQFSCAVVSNSLWPHGLQHVRLPCPSPTPRACSNSCPLSW